MRDLLGRFGHNKEEEELQHTYQRVFGSDLGQKVLTDLLTRMHFFDEVVSADEVALQNFARKILYIMGIWQAMNAPRIVRDFFRLPTQSKEDSS